MKLVPRRESNREPCDPQSRDLSTRPRHDGSMAHQLYAIDLYFNFILHPSLNFVRPIQLKYIIELSNSIAKSIISVLYNELQIWQ